MNDVFISYRSADARFGAAAAYELLAGRFGRQRVFLDNQSIAPGMPYVTELERALEAMRVLIVLIGPHWLGEDTVRSPLECPGDWVRREIGRALAREVPVIPVLLDGTALPADDRLPPDVRPVLRYQAMEINHRSLGADVGRLADRLAALIPTGTGGPAPLLRQLPVRLAGFVGRTEELAELDRWSSGDVSRVVVLCGTPGVGKTTVATQWAHNSADRFPDGVLHVNLRGFDRRATLDPADVLHGFLNALGFSADSVPDTVDARSALYRSTLADRRMLVLLDNAYTAEQVRPLLPGSPTCLVLITSRTRLTGLAVREGARHLTLGYLPEPEAHRLLAIRIGARRLLAEPGTADAIVEWCAGLPLALSLVAALADQRPGSLAALVRELRDERTKLDLLELGDDDLDLRSIFSWSYRSLSVEARDLFRVIGLHPGPHISKECCYAVRPPANVRRSLDELVRSGLITEHEPTRYSLHDLLRSYAAECAERDMSEADLRVLRTRIADFYLHRLTAAAEWLDPSTTRLTAITQRSTDFASYADALAWCIAEYRVLLALIESTGHHRLNSYVWQLASRCNAFLRRTGRRQERVAVHRAAKAAALRAGDRRAWANSSRELASALARLDRHEEGYELLDAALPVLESEQDQFGRLQAHLAYSRMFEAQGRFEAALGHARAAFALADDGTTAHADALSQLGHQLAMTGDPSAGLAACSEALRLYRSLEHTEGESSCLLTLGIIHQGMNDYVEAAIHYEKSCALDRMLGDRYWEAHCLDRLGEVWSLLGRDALAQRYWGEALTVFESLRHPEASRVRGRLHPPDRADAEPSERTT